MRSSPTIGHNNPAAEGLQYPLQFSLKSINSKPLDKFWKRFMHIPFIDLARSIVPIENEILSDWQRCLRATEFVGGKTVVEFEKKLAQKLGVNNAIGCSNGTDAIMVGLQAMGIEAGMKVAMPNMTFWAPFEAVKLLGAEPVLIDFDPDDLQMCFEEFKKAYDQFRFQGAILVHLFGWASNRLHDYRAFCKENGIRLLEDSAQAFGVEENNKSILAGADVATLSFYPAKVLGACGDAGAVVCSDSKTAEMVRTLCNHGRAGHYTYDYVGWNARLGSLQASFMLSMLRRVDDFIASRKTAMNYYSERFGNTKDLIYYKEPARFSGNGYLNVFYSKKAYGDELVAFMQKNNVGAARTYPQTMDEQPPAKNCPRVSDLKKSKEFSRRVVNLPQFAGITMRECEIAADIFQKALSTSK
jgi:UDP-2-acetamido-2-deoxy-ribo-hexuluronate aminotransferase